MFQKLSQGKKKRSRKGGKNLKGRKGNNSFWYTYHMFFRPMSYIRTFYGCIHEPRIENPFRSYISPSPLLSPSQAKLPIYSSTILFLPCPESFFISVPHPHLLLSRQFFLIRFFGLSSDNCRHIQALPQVHSEQTQARARAKKIATNGTPRKRTETTLLFFLPLQRTEKHHHHIAGTRRERQTGATNTQTQ